MALKPTDGEFHIKLADFETTGYQWFLQSYPEELVTPLGNETGGGVTEPPFLMVKFKATGKVGSGKVSLVHMKPWEHDPADQGHAYVAFSMSPAQLGNVTIPEVDFGQDELEKT